MGDSYYLLLICYGLSLFSGNHKFNIKTYDRLHNFLLSHQNQISVAVITWVLKEGIKKDSTK